MNLHKSFNALGLVAAASLLSVSVDAQEQGAKNRALANGRVGVGVEVLGLSGQDAVLTSILGPLFSGAIYPSGSRLYVPVLVNPSFRLEPSLYLARLSRDFGGATEIQLEWGAGLGAFYSMSPVRHAAIYVGPRVEFQYTSTTVKVNGPTDETSQSGFNVGAALGGEYFLSAVFSLGAEVQLNYLIVGESEGGVVAGPAAAENDSVYKDAQDRISTGTQAIVRYYFR